MKNVFMALAIFGLAFLAACKSASSSAKHNQLGPSAKTTEAHLAGAKQQSEQGQQPLVFPTQLDSSAIHSYSDYDKATELSYNRYLGRDRSARVEYFDISGKLLREFQAVEKAEKIKLRNSNREAYRDYMDALQIEDEQEQARLEKAFPEVAAYKKAVDPKWKGYQKALGQADKASVEIDREAYNTYLAEKAIAEAACKLVKCM